MPTAGIPAVEIRAEKKKVLERIRSENEVVFRILLFKMLFMAPKKTLDLFNPFNLTKNMK